MQETKRRYISPAAIPGAQVGDEVGDCAARVVQIGKDVATLDVNVEEKDMSCSKNCSVARFCISPDSV